MEENRGRLLVVATPLGNLEDITLRAIRVLREVDLVASEDTRRTRKLLSSLGIGVRLLSCNEHNERERVGDILEVLEKGRDAALVTDAGTPGVSDPGARLVREVRERGFTVLPVPGPSAVSSALSVSGMRADAYHFAGFLPNARGDRRKALETLAGLLVPVVFFEAPHRIMDALRDMIDVLGDRRAFLAREMTKVHETYLFGRLSHILDELRRSKRVRGEITIIVEGSARKAGQERAVTKEMKDLLSVLLSGKRMGVKEASTILSRLTGMKRGRIYQAALEINNEINNETNSEMNSEINKGEEGV